MTGARYVTTDEAARILGVSRQRVGALITEGKLPAVRMTPPHGGRGRQWLVSVDDIESRLTTIGRPPGYLTVEEVAVLLDRSPKTVGVWCTSGVMPSQIVAGRRYVSRATVDVFSLPPLGRPPHS